MQEIIPNAKILENESMNNSLRELIAKSIESLSKTVSSLSKLTHINTFYWRFIASCCNHIHVGVKDLHKLEVYSFVIERLGKIFLSYCQKQKGISQPLEAIPEDIEHTYNKTIKEYFQWVIRMQKVFVHWEELLTSKQSNYDDIMAYSQSLKTIKALATSLYVPHLTCEPEDIEEYKMFYSDHYANLHQLLIKHNQDVNRYVSVFKIIVCYR